VHIAARGAAGGHHGKVSVSLVAEQAVHFRLLQPMHACQPESIKTFKAFAISFFAVRFVAK